jgi:hypothetical protein
MGIAYPDVADAIEPWENGVPFANAQERLEEKYVGLRLHDVEKREDFDEYDEHRVIVKVRYWEGDDKNEPQFVCHAAILSVRGSVITSTAELEDDDEFYLINHALISLIQKSPYNTDVRFNTD